MCSALFAPKNVSENPKIFHFLPKGSSLHPRSRRRPPILGADKYEKLDSCDAFKMHPESQVAIEHEDPSSESLLSKDGYLGNPLCSSEVVPSQNPVKRQTRQWAAWTRHEEENFFNALRLVGKDFDKITCRVETKNKDQVRHYYYRLIRRMNKLLGPGLSLSAKNSKDTIAAMLRWWSLLEKYSCTASKLHLKPRRFKIFVEALENQLLKDRKKSKRRRSPQGENVSLTPSTTVSVLNKTPGNDARSMKVVIIDGHTIQKLGSGKGTSSMKRNINTSTGCNKGDPSAIKTARQRRRTVGPTSAAAYKKWEKAAMAGVNLVADAAEQLERTANSGQMCNPENQITMNEELPSQPSPSKDHLLSKESEGPCLQQIAKVGVQPSMKLKLQLFPVDEMTRRALEKDAHNPHLELTLSARKKINSVLEHLSRKWQNSSIMSSGELIIFPFGGRQGNIAACLKWTLKDSISTTADVYTAVGCPEIFRLRYGWFRGLEVNPVSFPASSTPPLSFDGLMQSNGIQEEHKEIADPDQSAPRLSYCYDQFELSKNQLHAAEEKTALEPFLTRSPEHNLIEGDQETHFSESSRNAIISSWLEEGNIETSKKQWDDAENVKTSNGTILSAGEWADSLTNISIGDLLSEVSGAADAIRAVRPAPCPQQVPFSCDSFDAAIASHISGGPQRIPTHVSIWDCEETCDAFSFQKVSLLDQDVSSPLRSGSKDGPFRLNNLDNSIGFHSFVEELASVGNAENPSCAREPAANSHSIRQSQDESEKIQCLTDMYWPDSLGPLDLEISSSGYQGQELILGDSISLSGLNRLIASSLDAFQNCSFFGSDKKDFSTDEAVGDCKVSAEV